MAKRASSSGNSGGRRSRRAAAVEANGRPPPAGHNQAVTPALIAEAVKQYMEDRRIIARAAAACGANLTRFEAQGVDPAMVKATAGMMKFTQAEAAERHGRQTEYMVAAGAVRAEDLDWSDDQGAFAFKPATGDAADRVAEERARQQGYKAGRKGHSKDGNPYKVRPGSPEFVGWLDGLQDGLDDRKARKPDAERTVHASTERKRREPLRAGAQARRSASGQPQDSQQANPAGDAAAQQPVPPAAGAAAETVH